MIDRGLLLSLAAVALVVTAAVRWVPPVTLPRRDFWDVAFPPLVVGVVTARLAAVALDDPGALGTIKDLLIIRSGMHFWAGVAGAVLAAGWSLRHRGSRSLLFSRMADLAPYGLWGYATYEVTCLVRDGCFGPPAAVGLRPLGLLETQFPVGVTVALVVAGLGAAVMHVASDHPRRSALLAVGGLALVRSVAAFWLPRLSAGPTRQQLESFAVALAVLLAGAGAWALNWYRSRPASSGPAISGGLSGGEQAR